MVASEKPRIRLVSLGGCQEIVVGPNPLVIGRDPHCDIRIGSLRVSRHHCCLTEVAGEVEVRDLGSTNGLRVNGRRMVSGRLKPGDQLSIAHLDFRVVADPEPELPMLRTLSETP
jgi:pSer/pThr/pTyr-binding forkhead associated (FHA) protein